MFSYIRLAVIALLLAGTGMSLPVQAQPSGLSQQQFDALVRSVSEAVVRQMQDKGVAPPAHATGAAQPDAAKAEPEPATNEATAVDALEKGFSSGAGAFLKRIQSTIAVYPKFGVTFEQVGAALSRNPARSLGDYLGLLLGGLLAAFIAETLLRKALTRVAARGTLSAVAVDLGALALFVAMAHGLDAVLVAGNDPQSRLAELTSIALVTWRVFALFFRVVLSPGIPSLRMAPVNDEEAWRLYRFFAGATFLILAARVWGRFGRTAGVTPDAQLATTLASILIVTLFMVFGFRYIRTAMTNWLDAMIAPDGVMLRAKQGIARNWAAIASIFYVATSVSYAYGAVIGRHGIGSGVNNTLVALGALLFIETAIDWLTGWKKPDQSNAATKPVEPKPIEVIGRCARMAARIAVLVLLMESWAVKALGLVKADEWDRMVNAVDNAAYALFAAYVAWALMQFFIKRYEIRNPVVAMTGDGDGEETDDRPTSASRLRTLLPLMRVVSATIILVIAVLVALSEMGVNIAPLIAGASIFGLAISFGSQTLVRDIVSGVFYLADDAFRIGEYIDTGKQKGTVEGFTLRSIKLRHQNGQLHTIPFGQLGSVTNFSRDWTTLKFNLRFARDTDLELLRKTTKKIGAEMAEDPELKKEFLEPLKMQGVADITDNALVARFKLTVRPVKPTFVQRQAVKRMLKVFPEKGIQFATATVSVQTVGGAAADPATMAAAANAAATAAAVPPPAS